MMLPNLSQVMTYSLLLGLIYSGNNKWVDVILS